MVRSRKAPLVPPPGPEPGRARAAAFVAVSEAELAAGNPAGAYAAARHATEQAPGWWAGFAALARAALSADRLRAARAAARRAVALDPARAEAHALLGRAHLARGKIGAARVAFGQALRLDPDYHDARDLWACLTAAFGSAGQREAYGYLERRVAAGQVIPELLAITVDDAVGRRARWLGMGVAVASLVYVGLAVGLEDTGYGTTNLVIPVIASAVVLLAYAWWAALLLRTMSPGARRLLRGLPRRDKLETLGLAGNTLSVLAMLTVPVWWAVGPETSVIVAVVVAFGLPVVTEVLVAGIELGRGRSRVRDVVVGALTRPYAVPFVFALAVLTLVVRATAAALRKIATIMRRGAPGGVDHEP